MKEKKTLPQALLSRVKKSALKVPRRAKKPFRTAAKNLGVSKKRIKAALKRPKSAPSPARARTSVAEPETPAAPTLGDLVRLGQKLSGLAGQLRTTGGRSLRKKK